MESGTQSRVGSSLIVFGRIFPSWWSVDLFTPSTPTVEGRNTRFVAWSAGNHAPQAFLALLTAISKARRTVS